MLSECIENEQVLIERCAQISDSLRAISSTRTDATRLSYMITFDPPRINTKLVSLATLALFVRMCFQIANLRHLNVSVDFALNAPCNGMR